MLIGYQLEQDTKNHCLIRTAPVVLILPFYCLPLITLPIPRSVSLFKDVKDLNIEGGSFDIQNAPVTNYRRHNALWSSLQPSPSDKDWQEKI